MRKSLVSLWGFLVFASVLAATPCAPSATSLCLSAGRFEVSVAWKDFQNHTGVGRAVPLTADTGYFWFFTDSNVELIVKVLDARSINGRFWVFFGALSNVEYTLTVRDSVSGVVKSYVNPSGQFASVGDTAAFEGSAAIAPAADRTVFVEGTRAAPESIEAVQRFVEKGILPRAASAPCPDALNGFYLGGCRFHLAVEWDDQRGHSGAGQPVALTGDTGYFWFFSSSNVELVVKVLDARGLNGHFWVFFGALSNVEYSLVVTDTLTGNVRKYSNPSGRFASVGDTGAFPGGRSVASTTDPTHAASRDIGSEGGILAATGADGSTFALEIPPKALAGPTTITLTPVSRIERMPFSGGLISGVEIEPEGLRLMAAATLTIAPSSPRPTDRTLTYAYLAHGEDFILYPRVGDASSIRVPVLHFSGYGAGEGSPGEGASESAAGPLAPYQELIAIWKNRELDGEISSDEYVGHVVEILGLAYDQVIRPRLEEAARSCEMAGLKPSLLLALEFTRLLQFLGFDGDLRLESISAEVYALCIRILETCQHTAFERCVARNDPFEAQLMLFIAGQLQAFGVEDPFLTTFIEDGVLESCLRFELDFQSKLVDETGYAGYSYTRRVRFRSEHVPLRLRLYGENAYARTAWDGGCTLVPELATMEYNRKPCSVECTAENGYTTVHAMWLDGLADWDPGRIKVFMLYDPGSPAVHGVEHCPGYVSEPTLFVPDFANQYQELHRLEYLENYGNITAGFMAKNWDPLRTAAGPSSNGWYFAKKSYERSTRLNETETFSEETILFLKHTPAAPMPSCP